MFTLMAMSQYSPVCEVLQVLFYLYNTSAPGVFNTWDIISHYVDISLGNNNLAVNSTIVSHPNDKCLGTLCYGYTHISVCL